MAGSDTWRGIAFQAAYTVGLALDVLSGDSGEILGVDPGPDIVDYSIRAAGRALLIGQAKTRGDPYTWAPGDLVGIIRRLAAVPDTDGARIEFVTDGSLSPETLSQLIPAIARASRSEASAEDWEYLGGHRMTPAQQDVLARVDVVSGYDSAGAQLDRAVRRIRTLRDLVAPVDDEKAQYLVLVLHREITERGTSRSGTSDLSREEIGEIVGVAPETVDAALAWSEELAARQRELITATPRPAEIVELSVESVDVTPAYAQLAATRVEQIRTTGFGERAKIRSALDLLDDDGAIVGSTGTGKSTTFAGLRRRAAAEGLTAVLLRPVSYRGGGLAALVRQQLSLELGVQLGPGAGVLILRHPDTVLLIDGAGEQSTVGMSAALARDVAELREQLNAPTVIVAARSVTTLRPFNLSVWKMRSLDRATRRKIASAVIGDEQQAAPVCAVLEREVPGPVENPLLFRMALALAMKERPPRTVGEIFAGFLDGLRAQAEPELEWSLALPCVGAVCAEMVAADSFSQPRWDWLVSLEQIVASLRERGLTVSLTAAEVADGLQNAGVLVASDGGGALSLLHDSFRDWLAAQAVKAGTAQLPDDISPCWSGVAGYLAEAGADAETLLAFCDDAEVATHAASIELREPADDGGKLASAAFCRLIQHFGSETRAGVEGMRIVTSEEDGRMKVLLVSDGDQKNPAAAVMGAELPEGSGPLACASAIWLEHLRYSLRPRPTVPDQIPSGRAQLAAAIESRFEAQRKELLRLSALVVPRLAERILGHAGWSGLEGHVGAAREEQGSSSHSFSYRYGASTTRVTIDQVEAADFTSRTTAEHWLQGNPHDAALDALRAALGDLLTGFSG